MAAGLCRVGSEIFPQKTTSKQKARDIIREATIRDHDRLERAEVCCHVMNADVWPHLRRHMAKRTSVDTELL